MALLVCITIKDIEGSSLFPASSLAFVVACFLDDSHFDWGEMESQ
jgi:hypothetical protein